MHLCWCCFVCLQSNRVRLPALNFESLEKWLSLDSLSKHNAYSCVSLNALNGRHDSPICSFSQSSNWLHFLLAIVQLKLHCPVHCFLSQLLSHYFGNNSPFCSDFFGMRKGLGFFGWIVSVFLGGGGRLCFMFLLVCCLSFFRACVCWGEMEQCWFLLTSTNFLQF